MPRPSPALKRSAADIFGSERVHNDGQVKSEPKKRSIRRGYFNKAGHARRTLVCGGTGDVSIEARICR